MQFKEFDWLSSHGIWAIIPCLTNMVSIRVNFWGRFYFHFRLVFHDFEGSLIKQLFHSRLLDMRSSWLLGATRLVDYLSSHIQRALTVTKALFKHCLYWSVLYSQCNFFFGLSSPNLLNCKEIVSVSWKVKVCKRQHAMIS